MKPLGISEPVAAGAVVGEAVVGRADTLARYDLKRYDVVCFSHLRWAFVYQRPQHLLSRCARGQRVFYVEEPVWEVGRPRLELTRAPGGPLVAVPHLPPGLSEEAAIRAQRALVAELFRSQGVEDFIAWYYTPMALPFTRHLAPAAVVYDCMDELANFRGAPRALADLERELFAVADVVFTGGQSLYEAKRGSHPNLHAAPSSIDRAHFARARAGLPDPADQAAIPGPRLGFFGVIDERMDTGLLAAVAGARPDWHIVMLGPVVKIDPAELPRLPNIHYLGGKRYEELPQYLANWDVALLPFACNEATRFISPTKTPEYLAAGKPVVSSPIRDVVRPYGELGLVRVASTPPAFVAAVGAALQADRREWLGAVDAFLAKTSWDETWERMMAEVARALQARALAGARV
jgi:glycosyltransferase involved in cell wall biosynthesis